VTNHLVCLSCYMDLWHKILRQVRESVLSVVHGGKDSSNRSSLSAELNSSLVLTLRLWRLFWQLASATIDAGSVARSSRCHRSLLWHCRLLSWRWCIPHRCRRSRCCVSRWLMHWIAATTGWRSAA